MDYALGEVGLTPRAFWRLCWPDYERLCLAYRAREDREWQRTRQLGTWMAAFNGVKLKNGQEVTPKDLYPLASDTTTTTSASTETEAEFLARMKSVNFFRPLKASA